MEERILLSTANADEQRLAVQQNGRLTDYLSLTPGNLDRKGNIYRGIVKKVEPDLGCFVDIGDGKEGLLKFEQVDFDALPLAENGVANTDVRSRIKRGTPLLVVIKRDSIGEKGPTLGMKDITLASIDLCLIPKEGRGHERGGPVLVSSRADDDDRKRILAAGDELRPRAGMKVIVRSSGAHKQVNELAWQLNNYLLPFWDKILEIFGALAGPGLIYADNNIVNICLRDFFSPQTKEMLCDDEATVNEIRATLGLFYPDIDKRVRLAERNRPLFGEHLLSEIDGLLARKVDLPSGGEIVIDPTEAMVAIDINSRRASTRPGIDNPALQTNKEAAAEIARQVRLRNLSGLIVIDFIDMNRADERRAVVTHLNRKLRGDRARITTGEISQFGLLELSRQNIGRALHVTHATTCEACQGTGHRLKVPSVARQKLDMLREYCMHRQNLRSVTLELPEKVATYMLNELRQDIVALQDDLGIKLVLLPSQDVHIPDHNLTASKQGNMSANDEQPSHEMKSTRTMDQKSYLSEHNRPARVEKGAISGPAMAAAGLPRPEPEPTQPAPAAHPPERPRAPAPAAAPAPAPATPAGQPAAPGGQQPSSSLFGRIMDLIKRPEVAQADPVPLAPPAAPPAPPATTTPASPQQQPARSHGAPGEGRSRRRPRRRGGRNRGAGGQGNNGRPGNGANQAGQPANQPQPPAGEQPRPSTAGHTPTPRSHGGPAQPASPPAQAPHARPAPGNGAAQPAPRHPRGPRPADSQQPGPSRPAPAAQPRQAPGGQPRQPAAGHAMPTGSPRPPAPPANQPTVHRDARMPSAGGTPATGGGSAPVAPRPPAPLAQQAPSTKRDAW